MKLKQQLEKISGDLTVVLDGFKGKLSEIETKLTGVEGVVETKFKEQYEAAKAELDTKATELKKSMDDFEKRMGRSGFAGGGGGKGLQTLGAQFVKSAQFTGARKEGSIRVSPVKIEGGVKLIKKQAMIPPEMRSFSLTETELGALIQEFRWDQVIQNPLRPRRIAAMIPTVPVSQNAVEYPEETVVHELYSELAAVANLGDTTVTMERVAGFYPSQKIWFEKGQPSQQEVTIDPGGIDYNANTITFTPALTAAHAKGSKVTSETFVYTEQSKLKPMSRLEYTTRTASIKTLATLMNVSKQMLDDFNALQTLIDNRMVEFIELQQERQLLYGNGGSQELEGILNNADILLYAQGGGDSKLDALRRAMTLAYLAFFPVDMIVLHPKDWEDIVLEKGTDGHYVFSQIQTSSGVSSVFQTPVIATPVIEQGTALVGSFQMGCVRWDREEVVLSIGDQNRDNFETNMVTLRAEMREGFSVLRPKSFVKVTFTP